MKTLFCKAALIGLPLVAQIQAGNHSDMASTNQSNAARWLSAARVAPDFAPPSTRRAWTNIRPKIRADLWKLLGDLPPRPKRLNVETILREDRGDYILEKFQFDNGAGAMVPGYLLIPKQTGGRSPAILYCHWHGGQYDNGKEEMFRSEHTPEAPGPALVKRGFVVLGIDAYCFGERNGQGPGGSGEKGGAGELTASKFNLWAGRTLWGMILRDDLLALHYLISHPEVDPERIGVTGISMGATRTWWLMALDERLKSGVAVGCLTRYQDLILNEGLKHHGIYYFVPGMLNHFDTEAVVALIAPRPILFLTGDQDQGSPVSGIRTIEERVREVYRLYGKEKDFQSRTCPNVGHVYLPDMWQRMMQHFEDSLVARSE